MRFERLLGSGGYSDVYLYRQQLPNRHVAVKVLKDAGLAEAQRRQFTAEANAMAGLADHPNIVPVFSAAVSPDGRPYIMMMFYSRPNLAVRAASERLGVAEVMRIGIQIASAVETAHRAGILHRDIKPANLLISPPTPPPSFSGARRRVRATIRVSPDVRSARRCATSPTPPTRTAASAPTSHHGAATGRGPASRNAQDHWDQVEGRDADLPLDLLGAPARRHVPVARGRRQASSPQHREDHLPYPDEVARGCTLPAGEGRSSRRVERLGQVLTEGMHAMTTDLASVTVDFCGEIFPVMSGEPFVIGREGAPAIDDNPYLHRRFLQVSDQDNLWWLANIGAALTATVADEAGTMQAWLAAGARSRSSSTGRSCGSPPARRPTSSTSCCSRRRSCR